MHSGILFSHKEKTNRTISNNKDGARRYYTLRNKPGGEGQESNDFCHLGSIRTEKALKEENSSRLTEPNNGLIVTKGKRTDVYGLQCRDEGWGERRHYY